MRGYQSLCLTHPLDEPRDAPQRLELWRDGRRLLRHGVTAISPWRDQVAAVGLDEAARIVHGNDLRVTGLCRGGMFPADTAAGRQASIDDNFRAIDEAAALGADCLVLVVGGLPGASKDIADARKQVQDGIAAILPHARAANMPLAIEPLHPMYAADRACVNTHRPGARHGRGAGRGGRRRDRRLPRLVGPQSAAAIARAGRLKRIFAHHICDWLVPTTDLLLDRGMMGDGVIDLRGIPRDDRGRGLFRAAGGRDFLARQLVEAAGGRGRPDLRRAVRAVLLTRLVLPRCRRGRGTAD